MSVREIHTEITRATRSEIAALSADPGRLHRGRPRQDGHPSHCLRLQTPGLVLCGSAVTALGPDVTVRRAAIDLAQPGDVVVVAAGGSRNARASGA